MDKINWTLLVGIVGGIVVIAASIFQWKDKKEEEKKALESELKAEIVQKELKQIQLENLN